MVNAAVVHTWGTTPTYTTLDLPAPNQNQVHIKVLAAGVHTIVRSRAAGQHFSVAGTQPPHVPGIDGVGTISGTSELVYFVALKAPTGSLADEIIVDKHDVFPLPAAADPRAVAVLANPAMSSWMALSARAGIKWGAAFKVCIVGATGVSGGAAVQIAKAFGATEIVAVGKPGAKLERTVELGATATIALAETPRETDFSAAADVDVVLDYLWGDVGQAALMGMVMKRANRSQRLTWVEIGSLAGEEMSVSSAVLRKANVVFMGCGPGSWTFKELGEQLPPMLEAIVEGGLRTEYVVRQLADVEGWWDEKGARVVVEP